MAEAVVFEGVSKKFALRRDRPRSFQEAVLSRLKGYRSTREEFWALRDVTFQVQPGQTVGFIGANGAGKSSVLKLISRIIDPTAGRIEVNGRVGALLELGAGFHPDLSGRENIYLNGSMLGLSRAQIKQRMDDIISFAELERFVDVPVKHYSSGMYVRLGFSTAVHADPEILAVDEVLAVGDAAFQQKCLDKMAQFKREGRTILFVSHALALIEQLCTVGVWLEEGQVREVGPAGVVAGHYKGAVAEQLETDLAHRNPGTVVPMRSGKLRIRHVAMIDRDGVATWSFDSREPVRIRIAYEALDTIEKPVFSVLIHRSDGLYVSSTNTFNICPFEVGPIRGQGELTVSLGELNLYEGDYLLSVGAYFEPDPPFWATPAHFLDKEFKFRMVSPGGAHGIVVIPATWEHHPSRAKDMS